MNLFDSGKHGEHLRMGINSHRNSEINCYAFSDMLIELFCHPFFKL